jgi:hypothetical protein
MSIFGDVIVWADGTNHKEANRDLLSQMSNMKLQF